MLRAVAATALVAACGGGATETAVEMPKAPRHPDGVVIEPPAALPSPKERASARGVVALREPLGEEAVREVVHAYVAAFEREDIDALEQLLTSDAVSLDARSRGSRAAVIDAWRARLKQLDYARIAGTEVVAFDRIERYDIDDLDAQGAPQRPVDMRPGDVLVRAPVATPRVGGDRFFGDTIVMLLRRQDGGRFKVAAVGEEGSP